MSILPVWVLVVVGAVLIALLSPQEQYLVWLPIVFAGAVILSFVVQLFIQRSDGFVTRVMASVGGSVLILAAATALLFALG